jgi:hypothetical protein
MKINEEIYCLNCEKMKTCPTGTHHPNWIMGKCEDFLEEDKEANHEN